MELDKLCRLCGEYSKTTYNVFSKNNSGQQLIQLIKQCLPVLVYRTDPLSKEICQTCYTKLNDYSSFITTSIETHDNFNSKLVDRINESPVRLYLDSLENANEPEHHVGHYRSPRSVRHFASQFTIETRTNCTNTVPPKATSPERSPPVKNITILTPSKINELSEKSTSTSVESEELEQPRKKRRLVGPKSKIRLITARSKEAPQSLLQCALTQVNRNLNLTLESHSELSEISENSQSPLPPAVATAVDNDDEYTHLSLLEPNIDIMEETNSCDTHIDLNEPVTCNYCFKRFRNIVALAHHEIRHIKVDIGPPVDTREFCVKQRKFAGYYQNWLSRQLMNDIEREHRQGTSNDGSQTTAEQDEKSAEEENSLLVPTYASTTHVFSIKDNEIYVDGVLLKSMDKKIRRTLYKDIMINGIKRKFCPLCRHTFKDNWAIEGHYFSASCQFTCKYCGRKFKYQKELFDEHLETHKGEPNNKIFGPKDRRYRFKKKKYMNHSSHGRQMYSQIITVPPPKVKPLKMKHLLQKKMSNPPQPIKIKTEPDLPPMNDAVTLEASGSANQQPYQAYFCRKCFKVFFKVDQYNHHTRMCTGERSGSSKTTTDTKVKNVVKSPETATPLKRPVRSCVKEIASLTDADDDSQDDEYTIKKSSGKKTPRAGFECGVCCSSFPTIHSRNSHMRIHKQQPQQQQPSQKTVLNKVAPKSHAIAKPEPQQPISAAAITQVKSPDIRLANLNPTVARLVQNNPHLTIRSYSKSEVEKQAEQQRQIRATSSSDNSNDTTPDHHIKRVYKCADCNEKFENKSVLYYHKMNSCVIKRHYECAFCRKKFGTYDQYNTHMFYVHPE